MAITLDDVYNRVMAIKQTLDDLPTRLLVRAGQIVIYSGLSDISENLGIIRAGEFRAGNRFDIGGGFSGMRMLYPPATYNSEKWNLVGVENDVMQFGVRASDGKLVAGGGSVVLDTNGITAIGGTIGGWQILSNRLTNSNISLYSTGSLQTNDFSSGVLGKGWKISSDGSAELNNAFIRGELRTTVLTYQEVQAVSGTMAIFKSAGTLRSQATVTSGTFTIDVNDPPLGHTAIFSIGDRLRIKAGAYDSWFNVTDVTDMTTYYRYTCSYVSGSQTTYEAGIAVINYGQSGQGLIEISTIGSSAPYMKFGKHTGTPHTEITEYLRIGNLQGNWGIQNSRWGIGIGEWKNNANYLIYTPEEGLYIRGRIIAEGGTVSTFRETFDYDDVSKFWARVFYTVSNNGEVSLVSNEGVSGGKILRVGDNSGNDELFVFIGQPIPYNPNKLYRMFVRFRRLSGTGSIYCGVGGIRSDGITPVNRNGQTDWVNQHYFVAATFQPPNTDWVEKVGYLSGSSSSIAWGERPNPDNPMPLHSDARYIVPMFIVNYNGQSGIYDIDEIRIDEISDTITADRIYSGTLTVGTKLTIGQVANNKGRLELEAKTDGTGTLKGIYRDNSGVDTTQAYFGSDGKFYAGGGIVKLDNEGFSILANPIYTPQQSLKFKKLNGITQFEIYSEEVGNYNKFIIESKSNSLFANEFNFFVKSDLYSAFSINSEIPTKIDVDLCYVRLSFYNSYDGSGTVVDNSLYLSSSFSIPDAYGTSNNIIFYHSYIHFIPHMDTISKAIRRKGMSLSSNELKFYEINYKIVAEFESYLIGRKGLLLSSDTSVLPPEHTLTLGQRTSAPSTIANHVSLYNFYGYLWIRNKDGNTIPLESTRTLSLGVGVWNGITTASATYSMQNNHPCWVFPDGVTKGIDASFAIPRHWVGKTIRVYIHYNSSVTTGTAILGVELRAINNGKNVSTGGGNVSVQLNVVANSSANTITRAGTGDLYITNGNGFYEDQAIAIRIFRSGGNANDTMAGDLRIFNVYVYLF